MGRPKLKKNEKVYKWSKVDYSFATYKFMSNDVDVAAIYPKETKEGRLVWCYYVKRIGTAKEINKSNFNTDAPIKLEAHYPKKRDAKKAIETVVKEIECQQHHGNS